VQTWSLHSSEWNHPAILATRDGEGDHRGVRLDVFRVLELGFGVADEVTAAAWR
jgi:hypothetical protein